jgi:Fur family transcriptional regulator, stress-responsive regulator
MAEISMERASARLREAGLRVTAQRMAVLTAIEELTGHPDAEAIRTRAQHITGGLSVQATYNVLRALTDTGLVRCTHVPGVSSRYEIDRHDNHHHFACRTCGHIVDVECVIGAAPCLEASLPDTYKIDEAAVTFWGKCPQCASSGGKVGVESAQCEWAG